MLHVLGCYLLTCQYRNGLQNTQQLFLINLSVSEGALNFLQLLTNHVDPTSSGLINNLKAGNISTTNHVHRLSSSDISSSPSTVATMIRHYIKTVRGYGFTTMYFLTMIYLTFDKLLDIYLNIRYHLFWNERRTKKLIVVTWCITLTSAILVSVAYHFTGFNDHETLDLYVYPTLDVIFLFIASLTYVFIFHKYKKSRIPPVPMNINQSAVRLSTFKVFQKSRFYIPVLLITSFIIFVAIPDFIQMAFVAKGFTHDGHDSVHELRILWAMSFLIDAIRAFLVGN